MKDGFTRKKVESLTLGEKLKKLRSDFRMSLSEVSKATRIQVKYLEYLESGQYEKLPADVYVRGFLRSYARYLNIDEQTFIKLYEQERNIQANLSRDVVKKTFNARNLSVSAFVITPRSLAIAMIFLLVGGAFFYLYREFRSFAGEPRLVILSPENGLIIEKNEVTVNGKTDKGARVSLNNQPVFVGSEGEFSGILLLQPGLNTVTVRSINRFDKEKSETFSVEARYAPSVAETDRQAEETGGNISALILEVRSGTQPVRLTLEADDTVVYSGILKPGESRLAEAKERIRIDSDKPEETYIRFNGSEEQVLSVEKGAVQDIIFTAAGRQP